MSLLESLIDGVDATTTSSLIGRDVIICRATWPCSSYRPVAILSWRLTGRQAALLMNEPSWRCSMARHGDSSQGATIGMNALVRRSGGIDLHRMIDVLPMKYENDASLLMCWALIAHAR